MCGMTAIGVRWKRHIELPEFGSTCTYWAVKYNGETRYIAKPHPEFAEATRRLMRPLYAVRVRARSI